MSGLIGAIIGFAVRGRYQDALLGGIVGMAIAKRQSSGLGAISSKKMDKKIKEAQERACGKWTPGMAYCFGGKWWSGGEKDFKAALSASASNSTDQSIRDLAMQKMTQKAKGYNAAEIIGQTTTVVDRPDQTPVTGPPFATDTALEIQQIQQQNLQYKLSPQVQDIEQAKNLGFQADQARVMADALRPSPVLPMTTQQYNAYVDRVAYANKLIDAYNVDMKGALARKIPFDTQWFGIKGSTQATADLSNFRPMERINPVSFIPNQNDQTSYAGGSQSKRPDKAASTASGGGSGSKSTAILPSGLTEREADFLAIANKSVAQAYMNYKQSGVEPVGSNASAIKFMYQYLNDPATDPANQVGTTAWVSIIAKTPDISSILPLSVQDGSVSLPSAQDIRNNQPTRYDFKFDTEGFALAKEIVDQPKFDPVKTATTMIKLGDLAASITRSIEDRVGNIKSEWNARDQFEIKMYADALTKSLALQAEMSAKDKTWSQTHGGVKVLNYDDALALAQSVRPMIDDAAKVKNGWKFADLLNGAVNWAQVELPNFSKTMSTSILNPMMHGLGTAAKPSGRKATSKIKAVTTTIKALSTKALRRQMKKIAEAYKIAKARVGKKSKSGMLGFEMPSLRAQS